jgi:hypothetical protein
VGCSGRGSLRRARPSCVWIDARDTTSCLRDRDKSMQQDRGDQRLRAGSQAADLLYKVSRRILCGNTVRCDHRCEFRDRIRQRTMKCFRWKRLELSMRASRSMLLGRRTHSVLISERVIRLSIIRRHICSGSLLPFNIYLTVPRDA